MSLIFNKNAIDQKPFTSQYLPLTIILLEQWIMITISGPDTISYLQGQLTCDIANLCKNQYSFAAHCNENGKIYSNICVFYHNNQVSFITRRSVYEHQLIALKKYSIFSKISINVNKDINLLGVAGVNSSLLLSSIFDKIPDMKNSIVQYHNTTILYFNRPVIRFLLITTNKLRDILLNQLSYKTIFNNSKQWLTLDIEAGYPIIDYAVMNKLTPYAVNLHKLGGICFTKGCYLGQEIIARIKYRGMNKQQLYFLSGKSKVIPLAGENLEIKIGSSWRNTGIVLTACMMHNKQLWVQAVLSKNVDKNSKIRIQKDINSLLKIC
ncbi:tRNA-modifying protein YgfZ [Candidatus Palibaumannia cicadellinicola]|uniref:tRNA-modifying protein YgfZ n=1 Tax=Candidatus Palibaumannia cicadellinicola TaxID=186490 RepID=A0A0K2BKK8_9GAMM|nr:tRNA-modifying protein YgfZ [Candidatus Baumannia cicadellinicola]AKZ65747.1 Folate-dependent protein for Fe/S cluster synthesis/repair in oxidative stress [Candidatus Baumannia cicadellinicola]